VPAHIGTAQVWGGGAWRAELDAVAAGRFTAVWVDILGGILVASVYRWVGELWRERNARLIELVGVALRTQRCPWILGGRLQYDPGLVE